MAVNVTGDFEGKYIAPLIFLPFLENSFKYGAHEIAGQAWISLDLVVTGDQLRFKLINGKPHENGTHISSGIGLQNVKKRLQMLYPGAHELRIKEDSETFRVHLQIRLDKIRLPEPDEEVKLPFGG
jgi:LytS/YehU family sensor histidine kinase